jgi:hypothetical protein
MYGEPKRMEKTEVVAYFSANHLVGKTEEKYIRSESDIRCPSRVNYLRNKHIALGDFETQRAGEAQSV